jgi:ferric-dicitrate binding protein FerR (iron transport regulator)
MKDKYLTYNVDELITDEDFLSWIKEGEKSDQWEKWLSEHPGQEKIFMEARKFVDGISFTTHALDEGLKKDMWKAIDSATTDQSVKTKSRRLFMMRTVAAAAAVAVILYSIFGFDKGVLISTDIGGQELVQLPDNSSVKLNAVSSVQYNGKDFLNERKLKLKGEGFFEVEKGSRFTVETDLGSVEVLGTSFNVYARGDSLSVACYTGRVMVNNGKDEVILNPGETVEIGRSKKNLEKVEFEKAEEEAPTWINGMFTFENEKLSVVFEELKRQYNVYIEYNDSTIPDQVTGVLFFESGNLDEALRNIAFTEKLEYNLEGKKVTLSR